MNDNAQPIFANGKICYLEIPTIDVQQSSRFYKNVFNWTIRHDNAGNVSFDDTVGQVSGMWVLNRPTSATPGILISIMVRSVADTLKLIVSNDGKIVQSPDRGAQEVTARFSDPTGNVFCLYQDEHAIDT